LSALNFLLIIHESVRCFDAVAMKIRYKNVYCFQ